MEDEEGVEPAAAAVRRDGANAGAGASVTARLGN